MNEVECKGLLNLET